MTIRRLPVPAGLRAPSPAAIERELDMIELLQAMNGIQTEFVATVRGMQANGVLFSGSFTLDANGQWHKTFPVPFAFVYVACAASITVTNGPPQAAPPPWGPGVFPSAGYDGMGWNMAGRSLTIYGPPGQLGLIEIDVKPHKASVDEAAQVGPAQIQTLILTTSQTVPVPAWAAYAECFALGSGGGGGGGGSSSGVASQVGGAGGGAALGDYQTIPVSGGSLVVTVAGGGSGGAGGAAGGNPGGFGGNGSNSTVTYGGVVQVRGYNGRGGTNSAGNSSTAVFGGAPGTTGITWTMTQGSLGAGGSSANWSQGGMFGVTGGSGGQTATATNGGLGAQFSPATGQSAANTGNGGAPDANGTAANASTIAGCAGGGGGGGAPGGAGGAGGAGANGKVVITFRSS